ncbi:type I-E CRISPR-associated protein Cas6/Cse3/CasE [Gilliamella sp. B2776]|uniref:type I-E CRISPR-associated protein Cas6/Cse3/CasE n=1 Tax=unclassified Gilliamella TaxID=2685620 RepID=UPI00226AE3A1|nr:MULTISPECIES: type I-E CRISPR-associated protein Cas6/Cse3/CasE [unclassified Gilliamella]MCX8648787.1 type I-E CRISPR-associated protein Cas6/Cse3/CasE [Gilliamella sp. B2779]MCX8653337.1 type I-E CRISPR-associated protein Cas6/Cse3/CasE [Gilliamella sp. B2737]MCX8655613.1 type I-E CRISPR-associated protein Cas6/Cse3/CasE [Gilliamella sp. B2894]MCX8664363.1 type I-E CRISPR-associated protein Cas6/Cse3/CasE [Gilliamella sp. B2887]MCX8690599.1 type I-E CRISPR-associated protein Cas6/Cse3/Cas
MYFSRITLKLNRLPYVMQKKIQYAGLYAIHQWLWQLFPNQDKRTFLFREEQTNKVSQYYILSEVAPITDHELFFVETKRYFPQLSLGMKLAFSLRVNPVVFKKGKRSDVMMNVKYLAKKQDLSELDLKNRQNEAALNWLIKQSENRGFSLFQNNEKQVRCDVIGTKQHQLHKRTGMNPITFTSVDFEGILTVTDPQLFLETLYQGIGKSKGFGCGLFLIKRYQ